MLKQVQHDKMEKGTENFGAFFVIKEDFLYYLRRKLSEKRIHYLDVFAGVLGEI